MLKKDATSEFYFEDSRLKMTWAGRLLVRVVGYATLLFLLVATLTFLVSGMEWLISLGGLLALLMIDYLLHAREADKPLSELPKTGRINLGNYIQPAVFKVLEKAMDQSVLKKTILPLELIKQLVSLRSIRGGLLRMDVPLGEFAQKLDEFLVQGSKEAVPDKAARSGQIEKLVQEAGQHALTTGHKFIEPSDLFHALFSLKEELPARLLNMFGIDRGDLEKVMIFSSLKDEFSRLKFLPATLGGFTLGISKRRRHRIMNRAWTSRPTPMLDRYSVDLTDLARQERVGFLVGHKIEYGRLVDALARPINPNAILVGEGGIGKEAVVAHLAFDISKDKVPEALFDKRLVLLNLGELVAGASQEQLQARLQNIVREIEMAGNVILYLPEFHNLVKTSGTAYLSVADALVPIIKNNVFPIVGSTYPREFKEAIESRSDILGLFEVIQVNEITEMEAEEILVYRSLILEREAKLTISFGAIKKAVKLAKKYFANRFLPASADDLLKSAVVEAKRLGEKTVGPDLVIKVAEAKTNIPIHEAKGEEVEKLIKFEEIIHERLVDQEEAVKAVGNVLREYRSGLTKSGKPIASFLFVGPTGVGKTELAKILAEIMFGSKEMMVRFDMTEYQDKQSFFRLIGSPDGKVFGALTDIILKKPYSLVLLDEFEKAYPDILNLFLQVFDDGRLTDNLGRTVDFQNTILIATSNAHSDIINEALRVGEKMAGMAEYLKRKLTDVFKPELLNRFSKIIVFNNLSAEDVIKVAALNLKEFAKTASERGIALTFDEAVIAQVARLGYEPAFGARPLQRVIEEKLRAPLAEKILKKEVSRNGKYKVVLRDSKFEFENEN
ncbi:MAG: ATP-dependent Clp protease ATP-binding subunit [Candidatus Liptonbacteria bacterium]|nr:ATP-dependent Clp protease ATP-binding subunit [Candidatus Liptonbacteria bacterium]